MALPRRSQRLDRDHLERLLLEATPERGEELAAWFKTHPVDLQIADDGKEAFLCATSQQIGFDHKTLRLYWLLGHAGWQAIGCYSPGCHCCLAGNSLDSILSADQALTGHEVRLQDLLFTANALLAAPEADAVPWPDSIPEPGDTPPERASDEARVTFDLVMLATAFAFLHEMRHVTFATAGDRPESPREEESICDSWARDFLLDRTDAYCERKNVATDAVLQKRASGLALGAFILYGITPSSGHGGSDDYPPLADRMDALLSATALPPNNRFWLYGACLMLAILRQKGRSPAVTASSYKELCGILIDELREAA